MMTSCDGKACIVVLNWNGKVLLRNCLESIRDNTVYPHEVVVVDNGSTDGSVRMVEAEFPGARLIRNGENLGFSGGNNRGIKYALGAGFCYILLLNNDIEVLQQGWLKELVRAAGCAGVGIVSCKVVLPSGEEPHRISGKILADGIIDAHTVSGAAFLIRKDVVDKVGLLDEGFTPIFHDETDFFIRAREAGYKIAYTPKVKLIHRERATRKKMNVGFLYFVDRRNALRLKLLHYPISSVAWELIHGFLVVFIRKKNPIELQNDIPMRMALFTRACLAIIRGFGEIYYQRKNRGMKLWF